VTVPFLVPCLATLRSEFNQLNPGRDKGADGWIGDAAHQATTSDHNPDAQGRVLAVDIDNDGPWPAPFGELVESLRGDYRLEYIIWDRRIASRTQGWTWRTYTGTADPHTGHAHFSARHDHTGNTSTATWNLEDDVMAPTVSDILDGLNAELRAETPLAKIMRAVPWQYAGRWHPRRRHYPLRTRRCPAHQLDEAALGEQVASSLAPQILAALPAGTLTVQDV
jgi:hypothetical protein